MIMKNTTAGSICETRSKHEGRKTLDKLLTCITETQELSAGPRVTSNYELYQKGTTLKHVEGFCLQNQNRELVPL